MLAETLEAQFGVASKMHNGISGGKGPSPLNVSIDGGLGVGFPTTEDLYFACGLAATTRLVGALENWRVASVLTVVIYTYTVRA